MFFNTEGLIFYKLHPMSKKVKANYIMEALSWFRAIFKKKRLEILVFLL
jgi:hypothetical protein